jgi:glutaconate CoA-transferase subunit A
VDALVHVPHGAYPHECYGRYDAEPDHFGAYVEGINARGSAAVQEYLGRYVYGPATHAEYLALFGAAVLADAERRGKELVS